MCDNRLTIEILNDIKNTKTNVECSYRFERDIPPTIKNMIHGLIKLGYVKRIEYRFLVKIKPIPEDLTLAMIKEQSKGIRLDKYTSTWAKTVNFINDSETDTNIIINKDKIDRHTSYHGINTIDSYINILSRIGFVEIVENNRKLIVNRIKPIPESLSSSKCSKLVKDPNFKRRLKIEKILEKHENIKKDK